jgi:amino acid adenylation domain-containing protein
MGDPVRHEFVHQLFRRSAEKNPERTAIERGPERMSYGALEAISNRMAGHLLEDGAETGSLVGIVATDARDVIAAELAVLKAGCAFVPLDPTLPRKRLETMIQAVELGRFLVAPSFFATTRELWGDRARSLLPLATEEAGAGEEAPPPHVEVGGDAIAYVYFTSGSTGTPKAIAGRLKAIDHFIRWEIDTFGIDESCRVSQLTAPMFDAFLRDAFTPLCAGGTVCVPAERDILLDSRRLAEWIEEARLTLIHCAPSLLRTIQSEVLTADRFPSLRHVLVAGEPLLPSDVQRWCAAFDERIPLVNLYGPTETTMTKLFHIVSPADAQRRSVPIGKPIRGAQAVALDETGVICGPGKIGEIYIRTAYRSLGYYNDPELTKAVFVQNPLSRDADDIVYRTGDLGRMLADGSLEFLGRKDHQVKIRGLRIELGEIEDLLRRHPAVADAVVVGRDDVSKNRFLCAYFVPREHVTSDAVRAFLAEDLPEWMLPSVYVELAELPRTISGKVDRRALPAPVRPVGRDFVAPRTATEQTLADLFRQLLGVDQVGIHDSFFQLGGHSLLATQLLIRVRHAFQVEVPLRELFRAPTVADLALAVTQLQVQQENREDIASLLRQIESLSESELDSALREAGPAKASTGA